MLWFCPEHVVNKTRITTMPMLTIAATPLI